MGGKPPRRLLPYRDARKSFLQWYETCGNTDVQNHTALTIEHVVPHCIFKATRPELSGDMYNFILYPSKLNNKRNNLRMTDHIPIASNDLHVYDNEGEKSVIKTHADLFGKYAFSYIGNFVPLVQHRGMISRCIAYFVATYPEYAKDVFTKVIDPNILLMWYHMYPITESEMKLNKHIQRIQGNTNPFINHPEAIRDYMSEYVNMDVFASFDYSAHRCHTNVSLNDAVLDGDDTSCT